MKKCCVIVCVVWMYVCVFFLLAFVAWFNLEPMLLSTMKVFEFLLQSFTRMTFWSVIVLMKSNLGYQHSPSVFNSSLWQLTCDYVEFACVRMTLLPVDMWLCWVCASVSLCCLLHREREPAAIRAVYFWLMAQSHGTKDFITIGHTIANKQSWIHTG